MSRIISEEERKAITTPLHETTDKRFDYVPLNVEKTMQSHEVTEFYKAVHLILTQKVPHGNYRDIAVSRLEESCMFAIKGISHD